MILINKAEAKIVRERCPGTHIVRTMKNDSKRGHYYCTETREVRRLLSEIRGIEDTAPRKRRCRNNRNSRGKE